MYKIVYIFVIVYFNVVSLQKKGRDMTTLTIRDFRSYLAASLDLVDQGERILLHRGNKIYTIIIIEDSELEITPQLAEKIEKAR